MRIRHVVATALITLLLLPVQAFAITALYYTSSAESWVGNGETVLVTPVGGFEFTASRNYDNGVSFAVNDFNTNPDFWSTRWWYIDFVAPNDAPLAVGTYLNATRFPFQAPSSPGLAFIGNGRGNNTLTGSFSVLEASYAQDGAVLSFAADFLQYDEGIQSWWNIGAIRYNSSVAIAAVPEPSTSLLLLVGLALCTVGAAAKRRG